MVPILLLFNVLFVLFFIYIETWYFTVVPISFIIFVLLNLRDEIPDNDSDNKFNYKNILLSNIFFIAWWIIIMWVFWMIRYIDFWQLTQDYISPELLETWKLMFYLFLVNVFFWIFSYILNYKDWNKIFHFWTYFSLVLTLAYYFFHYWPESSLTVFTYLLPFLLWIYSFITFVIWNFRDAKYMRYIVFIYFCINVLLLIYELFDWFLYTKIFLFQIFLFIVYISIYLLKILIKKIRNSNKQVKIDKLEIILNDWKINSIQKQKKKNIDKFSLLFSFLEDMPDYVKFVLSILNVIFIWIQVYLFWQNIWNDDFLIVYEIIYWVSIWLFIWNYIILKLLNFSSIIQRLFMFLIVNFSIYLTVMNVLWNNTFYIVIIWIAWNLFNSLIIFFSHKIIKRWLLFREDYYFWILANFLAMIANCVFIWKLWFDPRLKLPIIMLYWWVYLFISLYNLKYIDKMRIT